MGNIYYFNKKIQKFNKKLVDTNRIMVYTKQWLASANSIFMGYS